MVLTLHPDIFKILTSLTGKYITERDCKRNIMSPFKQRWHCPINIGTLGTLIKTVFLDSKLFKFS